MNGSFCQDIGASYSCMCNVGFAGVNCEIGGMTAGAGAPPAPASQRACPPGTASDGASGCYDCPVGMYQPMMGEATCLACMPGKYSDISGSMVCNMCPAGTYSSYTGSTSCTSCSQGQSALPGSTACTGGH